MPPYAVCHVKHATQNDMYREGICCSDFDNRLTFVVRVQIAFPLESDIKCMDPAASAEAQKAAESATNIALVRAPPSYIPSLAKCSLSALYLCFMLICWQGLCWQGLFGKAYIGKEPPALHCCKHKAVLYTSACILISHPHYLLRCML